MAMEALRIDLPEWVGAYVAALARRFLDVDSRMAVAIGLARRNVEEGTGGPFGAAVFAEETGELLAVGVNLVEASNCSLAHAEMLALAGAQRRLGRYDLSSGTFGPCQLVTSVEPCAMCLGAIPWAGLRSVVCGARDEDAREVGFDEGSKPQPWAKSLTERGITVVQEVRREEAQAVLQDYLRRGGRIYNSGGV